ncbi:MAG: IPT/TIG domain-containing protein [Candidatus Sericytochromatia bacterium]|nr:IPT/TIG domain-containing protein [Candidatus Tanganyikabacteria bacterium]
MADRRLLGGISAAIVAVVSGCALSGVATRVAGRGDPPVDRAGLIAGFEPATTQAPASLPAGKGAVELTIRWPARVAQKIPDSADRVDFDVTTPAAAFVASTSVSRTGGAATATAAIELDAGSYRLNAGARAGTTVVATASAALAIVAGVRSALALTLAPAYLPAISGFQGAWGLPGDSVTIDGTNLGLSWAATPAVRFSTAAGSASAAVTGLSANALTVVVPAGAVSGVVSVSVDGSATTSAPFTVPTPALWALQTPIASAGDTIWLDGGFGRSVTVNFPGGVTAAATVLGPGRARAVVPAGATAGDLTVTTGGSTYGALSFRAPPFSLGLGSLFQSPYDQAGGGRQTPSLVTARDLFASVRVGPYLYVLGGYNGGPGLASIERARFDAAGNLGPFENASSLASIRLGHTCAVVGGYLYVIGGGTPARSTVERASIEANGNLGSFQIVPGVTLLTGRRYHGSATLGSYLYVFGGANEGGYLTSVERARIDASGNLGTFNAVPEAVLGISREDFATAVIGSYLYVIGGDTPGSYLNSVERATIDSAGNLGQFQVVSGVTLRTARQGVRIERVGASLYAFGGAASGVAQNAVERATIGSDGSLGDFQTVAGTVLSKARHAFGSAQIGNYIYAFGGDALPGVLGSVERIGVNAFGNLGAFATGSAALVVPRTDHRAAVIGDSAYVLGGYAGGELTSIERSVIGSDGSVGAFATTAVSLPSARRNFATSIARNRLYVIGGYNCCAPERSVIYAPINADGSLGSFVDLGNLLPAGRGYHPAAVIGDYLYVVGGFGGSYLDSVVRSTIGSDGSLTLFGDAGKNLGTARNNHTLAVIGNYLYAVGGQNSSGLAEGSVERAAINADGTLGAFAGAGVSLVTPRLQHASAVIGDYLYVFGGRSNDTPIVYFDSVERARINADGTLGAFATVPGRNLAVARNALTAAPLGDSLLLVGGTNGSPLGSVERAPLQ